MILKNISNLIFSSVSMAFLVIVSWSIAYAYGWGQSYFYGYPRWYVDINTGNIARSIGYVVFVTLILLFFSAINIWIVRQVKPFICISTLNFLRAFVVSGILWLPIMLMGFLLLEELHILLLISYALLVIVSTLILRSYIGQFVSEINTEQVVRYLKRRQHYVMIYLFCYGVLSAFITGYVKPYLTDHFEMLEFDQQMYYVVAKYDDVIILSKDVKRDRENFYIHRISTNTFRHLRVNQPLGTQQFCASRH